MRYLSVCSGVEAATVAWHHMGWQAAGFSEIEKFPSEVLAHHYPIVTNFGDMTKYKEWNLDDPIGLLVGGTPCQSFSVAGLRKGLEDPRGNLALTYVGILDKFRPKWCVWENVPGVLSSGGGRDFGAFLGALAELGYGFAYRVLDAQNFGVAQRRRRVFVVGHLGDWKPAAEVLFESESLRGDTKKGRKKRQDSAAFTASGFGNYGEGVGTIRASGGDLGGGSETLIASRMVGFGDYTTDGTASTVKARDYKDATDLVTIVYENHASDSRIKEVDVSPTVTAKWGTGGNNVPLAMQGNLIGGDKGGPQGIGVSDSNTMYTMTKTDVHAVAVGVDTYNASESGDIAVTLTASGNSSTNSGPKVMQGMAVRRLTPIECERLQGFPDDYTNIKDKCPDGPRYKTMGNSMAVPVMRWIGKRIQMVEDGLL
jgi:DNA (cytosine-5)-methyltransferase 1